MENTEPTKGSEERRAPMRAASQMATDAIDDEKAQADLQSALAEMRQTVDAIPELVTIMAPDGRALYVNHQVVAFTGLTREDLLAGSCPKLVVHPDDEQWVADTIKHSLGQGVPFEMEYRVRNRHGIYRWLMNRFKPAVDEQGTVLRWYMAGTDVDDRRRAEEQRSRLQQELERERDRLRLVLDVQNLLLTNLNLCALFERLAATLRRITQCDFIGLALPDPASGELRQHFVDSPQDRCITRDGMLIPLYGSAAGKAFRSRRLVSIEKAGEAPDPEIYGSPAGERFFQVLQRRGAPAGYFLPLVIGDDVIGVMQLLKAAEMPIRREDSDFLSAIVKQLSAAVANSLEHEQVLRSREELAREQVYLREEIDQTSMFEEIVGSSNSLRRVLSEIAKVAPSDSTVLILGETGTGKELIARAIHKRSRRNAKAFVRVNCAAIPQSLIASELFGHEKGAFTGALQRRLGRFEAANGGTIFLDEVGDLPAETQVALLRVLQEREIERVGSAQPIPIDVRVLAATNKNLEEAVAAGTFRSDLFYRLHVFPMLVPSLRERPEDIPVLIEYFIYRFGKKAGKRFRSIDRATFDHLKAYSWPGNIRELQNVIERAVILCEDDTFSIDSSWLKIEPRRRQQPSIPFALSVADREREMIETALTQSDGKISGASGAAERLGIPRQTLESKISSLGIDKRRFKNRVAD